MWPSRYRNQVTEWWGETSRRRSVILGAPTVPTCSRVNECPQSRVVLISFTKRHNINRYVVLLEPLPQLDKGFLVHTKWGTYKHDDTLTLILVLAVLKRKLSDLDSGGNIGLATNFESVKGRQNLADILRRRDEHFRPGAHSGCTSISGIDNTHVFPAILITPTVFSGLDCVFAPNMTLTASDCALKREGVKSPFRMNSELSTLRSAVSAEYS